MTSKKVKFVGAVLALLLASGPNIAAYLVTAGVWYCFGWFLLAVYGRLRS